MIHTALANNCLKLLTAKATYDASKKQCYITGTGFCYLGLSATEVNSKGERVLNEDGSNFNEPNSATYPSYKRIQLAVATALEYTDVWGPVVNGTVSNVNEFISSECMEEEGWPVFYHFGIFDAKEGGNLLASGILRDPDADPDPETGLRPEKPLTVAKNKVAVFRAGTLELTLK